MCAAPEIVQAMAAYETLLNDRARDSDFSEKAQAAKTSEPTVIAIAKFFTDCTIGCAQRTKSPASPIGRGALPLVKLKPSHTANAAKP
jgi:hypothetical protein